jgi:hypothetical protein
MRNRTTIMLGLYGGIGLFLASAVILPLLSEKTFARGAIEGAIGGAMVFALFAVFAALRPARYRESTKTIDPES